ncbi:MAG: 1-deoxy-D-xylulose-5-phosphate synthase [Candidatus Omnitrophica bacterium]|nr:1-deoxy-D-xylulose-5-phosphate synthase [Candidatus Omnitrophota bacterium]
MILKKINSPEDLKKLSPDQLPVLAGEIRKAIIEAVDLRGGHLASSLGAVELCVTLHYCMNTPRDTLLFDVGHQSYAHKILTGRRDRFSSLRQHKGISGFPNSRESEYDEYISGHASTAVSWATGIAEAKRQKNDRSRTVALIGDGSLTGGMCFEALNHCGHSQSDVLIIFNHNAMSISPSVGALSNYLTKFLSAPIYNRIKNEMESFLTHFSLIKKLAPRAKKFEEALKGIMVPGIFFEELGFRYFGPLDGHDTDSLVPALKNVLSLKGPRILHVITQKGKGFSHAENNPEDFHSAKPCCVTAPHLPRQSETFSDAFARKLSAMGEKDQSLVAITAAMPKGTGLDRFQKNFPRRTYDVGIAESHAVGFASGLAKKGLTPVVAIYSTFLQRSFDQIIHDVALQNLRVIFALDRAGLVGSDGPTHHGVFDIGYLRMIPGLTIMAPKDSAELEDMLEFSTTLNTAAALRYPRECAYTLGSRTPVHLGKGEYLTQGTEVGIIAIGSMVRIGLQAAERLEENGISAALVNARFVKPLDEALLCDLASSCRLIVTLEEGSLAGGFGSAVAELYAQKNIFDHVRLIRMGIPDSFIPAGTREELFKLCKIDAESISRGILAALEKKTTWQK